MVIAEFWQALDIIRLWADSRRYAVTFRAKVSITVAAPRDAGREAAALCSFLSMVTGQKWSCKSEPVKGCVFITFAHAPKPESIPAAKLPEQGKLF